MGKLNTSGNGAKGNVRRGGQPICNGARIVVVNRRTGIGRKKGKDLVNFLGDLEIGIPILREDMDSGEKTQFRNEDAGVWIGSTSYSYKQVIENPERIYEVGRAYKNSQNRNIQIKTTNFGIITYIYRP
jgi:hypothetical protein